VPIRVGQHDVGRAVGPPFIVCVKEAAQVRLKSQYVEVIPAGFVTPYAGRIRARVQHGLGNAETGQILEGAVALAKIDVIGIGDVPDLCLGALERVQGPRIGDIERVQNDSIQDAEHHRVGANRQSHGQHRGDRKSGRSPHLA
jgi:hypothetical protein